MNNTSLIKGFEKVAAERFKTQEELAAFIDGFYKEAGATEMLKPLTKKAYDGVSFPGMMGVLGAGILGVAALKGINTLGTSITNNNLHNKFEMALAQVMSSNRVIKGSSPEKVKTYAETIFKFAPNVASDPNLLSSILANAVLGEGVDPMTIKTLVDLEGRYTENSSKGPITGMQLPKLG